MNISIILPHFKAFGGVRRFLEVGRELEKRSHDVRYLVTKQTDTNWFSKEWKPNIDYHVKPDLVLIGDPPSFNRLHQYLNNPIYVWVIAGGQYEAAYLALYAKATPTVRFLINNRSFAPTFPKARLCEGGVNTDFFKSDGRYRVGYSANRGASKGENEIKEMLGALNNIELVPMVGLEAEELLKTYLSLNYFVAWEQRRGWSNMAAEAISCGIPVVTNGRNCEPFSDRIIEVKDLKQFFLSPMEKYSWCNVVNKLEEIWKEDGLLKNG